MRLWHRLRDALGATLVEWGARIMTDEAKLRLRDAIAATARRDR